MKVVVVAICVLCSTILFGQRYNFKNYTVEDGLAQSQINDINQDDLGYLWIGTESGLSRFNGLEFVNYSVVNGLPDNKIEKIYLDQDQTIWIGTPMGLAKFEDDKFIPYLFSEPRRVNDIVSYKEQIYVATNDGLLQLKDETFELIDPYREDQLYIRALINLDDETLICGARTGIYAYDGAYTVFEDSSFLDYNILDLEIVEQRLIISAFRVGILEYNISSKKMSEYESEQVRFRSIYADSDVILGSAKDGAIEIIGQDITYFNESNGLINERLVCTFKDREGNYWIGTDGNGLLKFLGKSIISYSTADGLSSELVMSITQDADSSFIYGTYGEGLTKIFTTGESQFIQTEDGLRDNTVWTTVVDDEGYCWVGTTDGVNCVLDGKIVKEDLTSQIDSKIRSIAIIEDKYFFGGVDGIYVISGGHVLYLEHTEEINVNKMVVRDNDLYVGSRNGLYLLSGTDNYSTSKLIQTPEFNINAIAFDSRNNLWIGSQNGLFIRFDEGTTVPFELDRNNFKSRTVLGILQSKSGDIWVSSMNGVYQVKSLSDEDYSYTIYHYSTAEGLINTESNLNAIYEDNEEKIWVGTSSGLARINPSLNQELFDLENPELHLTGMRLFMEQFDYDRFDALYEVESDVPTSISLPYDQNHLTFDFIGINLKNPESVLYEYRLSGSNESWSPMSSGTYATYSDMSPGEYDFEVRATNKSYQWSPISSIHVTIRPPFWRTWWFIVGVFALSIMIILLLFQARIRTIKQREENEKLGYKNRLLFLEQQSLNASMNRHFIFNSLNSIQYFINSSDKLSANKYLSSFAKLIRKNLDSSTNNNFIVTLQEEIDRIELYLTLEKMRFQEKFEYEVNVSSALDTEGTDIPSMILQPFVENSIIHGVLPLDRKGHITVNIYEEYDDVVFEVIDDGVGIDNTIKNKKDSMAGDHESKGMEITSRRIELLRKLTGDNLLIIGPFQVNNEEGESLGTKVIIKMGIQVEH